MVIYQELADEYPDVVDFRHGLGRTHFYLGNVLPLTGRAAEGEAESRTSLEIFQSLADGNAAITRFRRSLGLGRNYFAGLLLQVGKPAEAEAECRKALELIQKLVDDDPTDYDFRRILAGCHGSLGDAARSSGRAAEAKWFYDRAIALQEQLLKDEPTFTLGRLTVFSSTRRRGLALRDLGDLAGAAADTRNALRMADGLASRSGDIIFERACCHAVLAGLAGRAGSGVPASEAEAEAATAMECLRRAVASGYRNTNELRIESALDPLRDRPDFKKLMAELEKNSTLHQEKK